MDDVGVKLEELLVVALRVTCLRLGHVRLLSPSTFASSLSLSLFFLNIFLIALLNT